MPTPKLDPEENVNVDAWYYEQMILKVWDKYIQTKSLKYFYFYDGCRKCVDSLFTSKDEASLSKNAGILLDKNALLGKLYKIKNSNDDGDNKDYSISICASVRNENVSGNKSGYNDITSNLKIALEQIKDWNANLWNKHKNIENHIVLFPYNLNNKHWCLGTLQINFKLNKNKIDAKLLIYDPLLSNSKFDSEVVKEIEELLRNVFEVKNISIDNFSGHKVKQQFDVVSCGVIVAENGKDIIDGSTKKLETIYESGARALRIQHLKEIANDVFTSQQKADISYKPFETHNFDAHIKEIAGNVFTFRQNTNNSYKSSESNNFDTHNYHYPERVPDLIQRTQLEERIREELEKNRIAILTGFKGYGKTVLAMQYFYEHLDSAAQYDYIAWIDCSVLSRISGEQSKTIKFTVWEKGTKSFNRITKSISLGQIAKVTSCNAINVANIHQKITQKVSDKSWLIIYDDVDSYSELMQESIPLNGHIICTSRYKNWPNSINVGPFSLNEGINYFENIFLKNYLLATAMQYREKYFENMNRVTDKGESFRSNADKLVKKLYGYPLALARAAKYIIENGFTLEKFVKEKKYKSLFDFDKITLEEFTGEDLSTLANETTAKAKQLLYYCTYLNHEGITREILEEIDRQVTKGNFDAEIFSSGLNLLIRYSIINKDSSSTKNYFYIPADLKRLLLNKLRGEEIDPGDELKNFVLEMIKERLKNHLLEANCNGEELIPAEQDIYMWVAHAKTLHKNLKWRKKFRDLEVDNFSYEENEINKLIDISIRNETLKYWDINNDISRLNIKPIMNYTCLANDGYNYSIFITEAVVNNISPEILFNTLNFAGNFSESNIDLNDRKILIPFFVSNLNYWLTIEIRMHEILNLQAQSWGVEMLAHDPYGNGDILKNYLSNIPTEFFRFLRGRRSNINFTVVNSNFKPQLQKNDVSSSGVIVVENILAIIRGDVPNKTCSLGCVDIRYQHLALVNQYALAGQNGEIKYADDIQQVQQYVSFLTRHWGFKSVQKQYPENIESLTSMAEFISLLGDWCFRHDLKRKKSYKCFLEAQTLYLQLICQKALTHSGESSNYDKIYNDHLKVTFQLATTGDQFFSLGYRNIANETAITPTSLSNTIKAYLQLKKTYGQQNEQHTIFNIDTREARQKALHTLYYLSISLNDAKKGFNEKNRKWLKAIHKLFSQFLRQRYGKTPKLDIKKIDENISEILSSKDFFKSDIYNNLLRNELSNAGLRLFGFYQSNQIQAEFKIADDIEKKLGKISEDDEKQKALKSVFKEIILKYVKAYYVPLLEKQKSIYSEFFNYAIHYGEDQSKKDYIDKFQYFFDKNVFFVGGKLIEKKISNFLKIKNNAVVIKDAEKMRVFFSLKLIDDKYFLEDKIALVFFYNIIYRNIIANFMLSGFKGEDRKTFYLKVGLLDYIIKSVADNLIKSDETVSFGLSLIKLRVMMRLDLSFICNHFEKKASKQIYKILSEVSQITNDYYKKLVKKINHVKENDREKIFKSSNELFLKVAQKVFSYFETTFPSVTKEQLNSIQEKLFKTILVNVQHAFTIHKAMLINPSHFYVKKVGDLYNRILSYFGRNTDIDEMEKYKKIGNHSDIKSLDKKLEEYNKDLDFYHVTGKNNDSNDASKIFEIRMNRARLCYFLCRYEDALHDCMILCKENSAFFKAFLLRAHVYYKMEKYSEAIDDFQYYLKYRSGDDDAKVWLSLAQKKEKLKPEDSDVLPLHLTNKNRFVNAFTNEFLIQAKHYVDIFLGADKRLNKSEKTARILSALSNLIPNVTASGPAGPVLISADTKPRDAAIELSQFYEQQAGAGKQYIASNISKRYDELKLAVNTIAKNIASDLEQQVDQLFGYSVVKFAKYSARKMLKNVGLNKTNPELPIEQQLRQALFRWEGNLTWGKFLTCHDHLWISRRWTAEGALTRTGVFTESNYFWRRRGFFKELSCDSKGKYKYRHGTDEEAFRLGYKHMYKKEEEDERDIKVSLPFFKK